MSGSVVRGVVVAIGAACAAGAVAAMVLCLYSTAAVLAFWGLILLLGLAIERWRYKPLGDASPGPGWEETDERFVDPETGRLVTVYFNPHTGQRRYVAAR